MKKAKINLNEVPRFIDLNGNDWTPQDFVTSLGNGIFTGRGLKLAIELDTIARTLHMGGDAQVSADELQELINIVDRTKLYVEWCQLIIIQYLTNKLKEIQDGNSENSK